MLCVGIYMKLSLQNYADLGMENSDAALLALACLGALVALVGLLACCCTARQHPALLYVVSDNKQPFALHCCLFSFVCV